VNYRSAARSYASRPVNTARADDSIRISRKQRLARNYSRAGAPGIKWRIRPHRSCCKRKRGRSIHRSCYEHSYSRISKEPVQCQRREISPRSSSAGFAALMSVTRELRRRLRAGQSLHRFDPCLPRPADEPPAGPGWIHEIKYDGFRHLAHRRGRRIPRRQKLTNCFA
jgi:hypothetical protein